jgi:hypothetical protein
MSWSAAFAVKDHTRSRPVLDRSTGVRPLSLGEELHLFGEITPDPCQPEQRRVADAFKRGLTDMCN